MYFELIFILNLYKSKRNHLNKSHIIKIIHLLFLLIGIQSACYAQRVGLVLSGGGATGFAHIGVLKALEERGIPIDYISGTSAGALVGSMYAVGFSPAEIEAYVLSDRFQLMASGKLEQKHNFLFQKEDENASLLQFGFSKDSLLQKSLPTSFITPTLLDFEMMRVLGVVGASVGGNFDQLFVPYRCVASDVILKKSIVFGSGNLNEAVRASMTYPFFLNPIRIDGKLLFDGGLYNNFPSDVMYSHFDPDYIIGSNVSVNAKPPKEDDLISQLTNMLVSTSNFKLPCEEGFIIKPVTAVSTFEFEDVQMAINDGYFSTIRILDSIDLSTLKRRIDPNELEAKRNAFKSKIKPLILKSINTLNEKGVDVSFVRKSILKNVKKIEINEELLTKRYFRIASIPQIAYLYPTVKLNTDSTYSMQINVRKSKDFKLEVGGHFSSLPVNTGYLGLSYFHMKKLAYQLKAESYFGKFYGSVKVKADIQIPSYYPVSISPYFAINRWDYFRSSATFFEDVKPSFLVQNEMYYGLQLKLPILNNSRTILDARVFDLSDNYYQTQNFLSSDTADNTRFYGYTFSWLLENNTLNRKQFANSGSYFGIKTRYISGEEKSISGSTSPTDYVFLKNHSWINISGEAQWFFIDKSHFHLGVHAKGVFNSQSLFRNYTASILSMTSFAPIPDANTLFQPLFRAPQHFGLGTNVIFTVKKNWDLRIDAYVYQPFKEVLQNPDGTVFYSDYIPDRQYMASTSLIYNSPFGPIRLTSNYFPSLSGDIRKEISFQFSFGYILFNERAIR